MKTLEEQVERAENREDLIAAEAMMNAVWMFVECSPVDDVAKKVGHKLVKEIETRIARVRRRL